MRAVLPSETMMGGMRLRLAAILTAALLIVPATAAQWSEIKADEEIAFFTTMGSRAASGAGWDMDIRGCVYEPERGRLALGLLKEALELKRVRMTPAEEARFQERARLFMVDHERGKRIVVRIGDAEFPLQKSRADGQFFGRVQISDEIAKQAGGQRVTIRAVLPSTDRRLFQGQVELVEPTGFTIVSDIDDTIKVTEVTNRRAMLRNTFLEEFRPVPHMAELYRGWAAEAGARVYYLSAGPWQLFTPLSEFIQTNRFPPGVLLLRDFRWKDQSFFNLFVRPDVYKTASIEELLRRFPNRRFVLVGDAGERDPEIYGALAHKHPTQIVRVFIRDVTGASAQARRYEKLRQDLPADVWRVFSDPATLTNASPTLLRGNM
jgi:phosphatidate phosphatase APP1